MSCTNDPETCSRFECPLHMASPTDDEIWHCYAGRGRAGPGVVWLSEAKGGLVEPSVAGLGGAGQSPARQGLINEVL